MQYSIGGPLLLSHCWFHEFDLLCDLLLLLLLPDLTISCRPWSKTINDQTHRNAQGRCSAEEFTDSSVGGEREGRSGRRKGRKNYEGKGTDLLRRDGRQLLPRLGRLHHHRCLLRDAALPSATKTDILWMQNMMLLPDAGQHRCC